MIIPRIYEVKGPVHVVRVVKRAVEHPSIFRQVGTGRHEYAPCGVYNAMWFHSKPTRGFSVKRYQVALRGSAELAMLNVGLARRASLGWNPVDCRNKTANYSAR